jgi:Tetratricopeptide repeat
MRAPSSGYVAVAALVCAVALPSRASAAEDEKEARRLFQKAELGFNLGKFEDALADYQSAYQAKPLTGFLFNIAQCYRNLGNWERARFFYRRYLTLEPRSPNRHRVEDLVAEMTERLEKREALLAPTKGSIGGPTAAAPSEHPAATASALTPPPAAAPPLPEPSGAGPATVSSTVSSTFVASPPVAPARQPVTKRWWFWTGVGVVVAGGVVAAFVLSRPATRTPGTLDPIDAR